MRERGIEMRERWRGETSGERGREEEGDRKKERK